ncbi:hypothetical protein IAD21_02438 [Abditibacteriota bacterium]|nr:hypothetical protein IAD21_02438 [Abditibacteriota bacterium]
MRKPPDYDISVFINCPYDEEYQPIFDSLVFAVTDLGFKARCALETRDSGDVRYGKIVQIISECRYGVHDLCRRDPTEVSGVNYPRFNMPFELGLFLMAQTYSKEPVLKKVLPPKSSLILDTEEHTYRIYLSDIGGHDVYAHKNDPTEAIRQVRTWLKNQTRRSMPGSQVTIDRYKTFLNDLPGLRESLRLEPEDVSFTDFLEMVYGWTGTNLIDLP